MKCASVVCVLLLLFVPAIVSAQDFNNRLADLATTPEVDTGGCWLSMSPLGYPVHYVPQSWASSNSTFWLNYNYPGVTDVKFVVKFPRGSVLKKHVQKFNNVVNGSVAPFAYSFVSGDDVQAIATGTAILRVTSNFVDCTYPFLVGGFNYESADTPIIPDGGLITMGVNVNPQGTVKKVVVTLSINHLLRQDLYIALRSPDGTQARLVLNRSGFPGLYGFGLSDHLRMILDDDAQHPISDCLDSCAELYRPDESLSVFNGRSEHGLWTLTVADADINGITGHVEAWSLIILD